MLCSRNRNVHKHPIHLDFVLKHHSGVWGHRQTLLFRLHNNFMLNFVIASTKNFSQYCPLNLILKKKFKVLPSLCDLKHIVPQGFIILKIHLPVFFLFFFLLRVHYALCSIVITDASLSLVSCVSQSIK